MPAYDGKNVHQQMRQLVAETTMTAQIHQEHCIDNLGFNEDIKIGQSYSESKAPGGNFSTGAKKQPRF